MCKADMELELDELEAAAVLVQEEEIELIMAAELKRMAVCQDTCVYFVISFKFYIIFYFDC